jgi:hypothetical protein
MHIERSFEIRSGKSLGLFTRSSLIGTLMGAVFFIAAIPVSASAQTREQIEAMQIAAQQAQKNADLAISQRDMLLAQPEDATLGASHRDSQQNQPKLRKAEANPSQQDVVSAADQPQPQQEPKSVTSEASVPAKPPAQNEQATALQNQANRSSSESARPQRIHRTRETKTQNSAVSTTATSSLSQLRNQWNRFWHIR